SGCPAGKSAGRMAIRKGDTRVVSRVFDSAPASKFSHGALTFWRVTHTRQNRVASSSRAMSVVQRAPFFDVLRRDVRLQYLNDRRQPIPEDRPAPERRSSFPPSSAYFNHAVLLPAIALRQ